MICVTSAACYLLIFLNATNDLNNIKHIGSSSFCPSITPEFPPLRAYQRTHRCPIGLVSPTDQFDTTAEVVIEANDGTKGELSFSTSAVTVNEETQLEVQLTLNRNRGTFGDVSIYVYASTKAKGAVNGEDFNFTDRVSGEGRC